MVKNKRTFGPDIETASNFVMFEPDNGNPSAKMKTEVKVLYDNDAFIFQPYYMTMS
jgi:hypothetical protein